MEDHTPDFLGFIQAHCFGVLYYTIYADIEFSNDARPCAKVKRNDIRVIVVLQKFLVHIQQKIIRTKNHGELFQPGTFFPEQLPNCMLNNGPVAEPGTLGLLRK
jgi:hypothetical protein